jgi:hypothetical protein
MIRKITNIAFILLWTITTTGFTISRHYCGERLISVSIDKEAKSCCGSESGCCRNENERFEIKDDFIVAPELEELSVPIHDNLFPLVYSYLSNIAVCDPDNIYNYKESHPPPGVRAILSELQTFRC